MLYESPSLLSQHALTSHHGRLLEDSGFTKLGYRLNSLEVLARTGMKPRLVSSYLSYRGETTGRWSSGRPAIQNIPKTDVPSTSLQALREVLCMQYTGMSRADWLYFARTSCLPTRLVLPDIADMPSWAPALGNTHSRGYSNVGAVCSHGLTQTLLDKLHVQSAVRPSLWWDFEYSTFVQTGTLKSTTSKQ